MAVETQVVGMSTYVRHDDLSAIYCGDRQHPDDHDVTAWMHPFDGRVYTYVPEERNWVLNLPGEWAIVRVERNKRIEAVRWRIDRERDLVQLNLADGTLLMSLLNYVQALRDIPQTQSDPLNIVWPVEP